MLQPVQGAHLCLYMSDMYCAHKIIRSLKDVAGHKLAEKATINCWQIILHGFNSGGIEIALFDQPVWMLGIWNDVQFMYVFPWETDRNRHCSSNSCVLVKQTTIVCAWTSVFWCKKVVLRRKETTFECCCRVHNTLVEILWWDRSFLSSQSISSCAFHSVCEKSACSAQQNNPFLLSWRTIWVFPNEVAGRLVITSLWHANGNHWLLHTVKSVEKPSPCTLLNIVRYPCNDSERGRPRNHLSGHLWCVCTWGNYTFRTLYRHFHSLQRYIETLQTTSRPSTTEV